MYRRLPGNILILLVCSILSISYLFRNNILPSTFLIPQYLNPAFSKLANTPTIINSFGLQDQQCTTTTTTLFPASTAPCTCPTTPISPQTPPEEVTQEEAVIARLRVQGIVVIFKTGAQELPNLAIQLGTTLRYLQPSDILFFSDFQSSLGPFVINDALRNVNQELKENDPDFEIYRQIALYQSTGRDISTLSEPLSKGDDRSGWKLDKYKFLHMIEETFEERPNAKWYVFIETDSYLFYPALATFLSRLDSTKPYYLGSAVSMGGTTFAHGGSGYVLSNAAMNRLLGPEMKEGVAAKWDAKLKGHCCGDVALAEALKEKGVEITVAHPLLNGYKPSTFTYGPGQHWCQPVVSMHHVLPAEVSAVWRFERRREMLVEGGNETVFAELYHHFVEPHLGDMREDWDNLSHGPTYEEPAKEAKEQTTRQKEAAEHVKVEEAKAKIKATEESKKSDDKVGEEDKRLLPGTKDTKSSKKTLKGGNNNWKQPTEEKKKEEKAEENSKDQTKTAMEGLLVDESKEREKIAKRSDEKAKNLVLIQAEKLAWKTFDHCRQVCIDREDCFQYVYYGTTCKLGLSFRLGKHVSPSEDGKVVWKSGWMVDRIRKWTEANACKGPEWPDIK